MTAPVSLARIGLGSNLGDAVGTIERALAALGRFGRLRARSSLYRTPPWGGVPQGDFVNAAALLETTLGPHALLVALQALEREFGRTPSLRYGPRTLDLDILAYDELVLTEPELTVPHPRLHERAFVLVPLAEIEPAFAAALAALPAQERMAIARISSAPAEEKGL